MTIHDGSNKFQQIRRLRSNEEPDSKMTAFIRTKSLSKASSSQKWDRTEYKNHISRSKFHLHLIRLWILTRNVWAETVSDGLNLSYSSPHGHENDSVLRSRHGYLRYIWEREVCSRGEKVTPSKAFIVKASPYDDNLPTSGWKKYACSSYGEARTDQGLLGSQRELALFLWGSFFSKQVVASQRGYS